MKKILFPLIFILSLAAQAADLPKEPKIIPAFTEVQVYGRVARILMEDRKKLDPTKTDDAQFAAAEKARRDQCTSMNSQVAATPGESLRDLLPGESQAKSDHNEYVDQFILLSDRLSTIDPGKRGMECFYNYYVDHKADVDARWKYLDPEVRKRLTTAAEQYSKGSIDRKVIVGQPPAEEPSRLDQFISDVKSLPGKILPGQH